MKKRKISILIIVVLVIINSLFYIVVNDSKQIKQKNEFDDWAKVRVELVNEYLKVAQASVDESKLKEMNSTLLILENKEEGNLDYKDVNRSLRIVIDKGWELNDAIEKGETVDIEGFRRAIEELNSNIKAQSKALNNKIIIYKLIK